MLFIETEKQKKGFTLASGYFFNIKNEKKISMYSVYLYVLIYTNSQCYFCIVADFIGVISTGSETKLFLNE